MSERFEGLAKSVARARQAPDFPMVVVPANIEELGDGELAELAEATFPRLAEEVTQG